jgi:hypothetical protein
MVDDPVDVSKLSDWEAYRARVEDLNWTTSTKYNPNGERQLVVDLRLPEVGGVVRTYVSLRLGMRQDGKPSKLTALLNALAGQEGTAKVAWFNDEEGDAEGANPYAWGYEPGVVAAVLEPGLELIVRGTVVQPEGKDRRYQIEAFSPAKRSSTRTPGLPSTTPAGNGARRAASARAATRVTVPPDDDISF